MYKKGIDCIIVGCNSEKFDENALKAKPFSHVSANYFDIKTNSILCNGKRFDYMEYLNKIVNEVTKKSVLLNTFKLPNLGVIYLKNFLENYQLNVEMINYFNSEKDKLKELLLLSPKSVAITTTYYVDMNPILEVIDFIKTYNPETKIIVGGPFVFSTYLHYQGDLLKEVLKKLKADVYIIESQGELALARVVNELKSGCSCDFSDIPNIGYIDKNNEICLTERMAEENNLEENSINWEHISSDLYTPTILLRTGRGCPFCCAFCNYHVISKHTLMSLQKVEEELTFLHNKGVKNILFIDDTFNVPIKRFKDLCKIMIRNNYRFKWVSFFRCSNTDDEVFALMKESGCIGVFLGIESGCQTILNNMNKFADTKRYMHAISKLNELGIITHGSFIVGFPGETKETILETLEFINKSKLTFYNLQVYFHDTVAPINNKKDEFGIKGQNYNWKHNTMNWKEACQWVEFLYKNVKNSIPISLEGFGLWAVPYLMQIGIPLNKIISIVEILSKMMIESLEDKERDFKDYDEALCELIRNIEFNFN